MTFVIARTDWSTNTVYTQYDDTANTTPSVVLDANNYSVYSCLWNANNANSVDPPSSGANGSHQYVKTTADGYVWKYLYSLPSGTSDKYLTNAWVPVYVESAVQVDAANNAGRLAIDVPLVVEDGGSYDPAEPIIATVVGDGAGATISNSSITLTGNNLTAISLVDGGARYTQVTSINVYQSGATAATVRAIIPPYPNHGYDLVSELDAKHIMISVLLDNRVGDVLTTSNEFRRLGLVLNPIERDSEEIANNDFYHQTYDLTLSANVGAFVADDVMYNANVAYSANLAVAPSGLVVDVIQNAAGNNVLRLTAVNAAGQVTPFVDGESVKDAATNTVQGFIANVALPELLPYTGTIIFASHHAPVQRTPDNFEEIKIVLPFGG
jgi:hypothetical protein